MSERVRKKKSVHKNSAYDLPLGGKKPHRVQKLFGCWSRQCFVINVFDKLPLEVEELIHGRNDHRSVIFHPFRPTELHTNNKSFSKGDFPVSSVEK